MTNIGKKGRVETNSKTGNVSSEVEIQLQNEFEEILNSDDGSEENSDIIKLEKENEKLHLSLRKLEEETSLLRSLFNKTHTELERLKRPALLVAELVSKYEGGRAIIKLSNGNKFYSHMASGLELQVGDAVLVEQKTLNILEKIETSNSIDVEKFVLIEKPTVNFKQIGGLSEVVQELKEVVELPLLKPELFKKIGIDPPKGILLHGPPGTGKTLLAKAVASVTNATFIEVTGSELVQKFIGEGSKLVKEIFALARRMSPTILFIDEIDALASARMPMGTSGEREVNRTFMQLLAELDGFKSLGNVKVIAATNRKDILDMAILRPGRLDRIIEVGLPNEEARKEILKIHSKDMSKEKGFKLKKIASMTDGFSGAELKAVCTEAGYFAIRENRDKVNFSDFEKAIAKVEKDEENELEGGMFG